MLLMVTEGTGGPASGYYVGLVLLFVGIGVLVPLSYKQAAWAISVLFALYAGVAAVGAKTIPWSSFGMHLFFLAAAGFEGIMSAGLLDRMRFADFVQRKELEEARDELRDLDEAKSRFTANVHHELRTPLTLMLAPIEAMQSREFGGLPREAADMLATAQANGLRLLNLINNLLDLAKIESSQLSIRRAPTELGRLVRSVLEGARPMAARKGLQLEIEGFSGLPLVNLDSDAFEKVLVNLVGNALKFTEQGYIRLRAAASDEGVHIAVEDSGVGIRRDQLDKVFDRFTQVDSSATRRHEGTGIGLSLARELMELHGGHIWAESDGLGQGLTMHLVLPIGEADIEITEGVLLPDPSEHGPLVERSLQMLGAEIEPDVKTLDGDGGRFAEFERTFSASEEAHAAIDVSSASTRSEHGPGTPNVLIVEDNPEMQRLLSFLVGREFRVRVARNGREALEIAHESHPTVVLTDVMMPVMSGIELCRTLKDDPSTRGIPVMLVTSKAEREMKIEGLELGADDYVTKPFHPRELMARVRSLVKLRQLQTEAEMRNALLTSTNAELQATLGELREASVRLAQAERLAAVGELAAGVAHEANNPMNFATNALRTLEGYVDDVEAVATAIEGVDWESVTHPEDRAREIDKLKKQLQFSEVVSALRELFGIISEGLERTQRLVGDLRDFASPGERTRVSVDVVKGLRSTTQLVAHSLRQANVELRLDVPDRLPHVLGDPRALNQVFLNVLKNAADSLAERGGVVEISAAEQEESVLVRIHDDGPGIPEDDLPHVFEPFFSTKHAGRGTGLGLSISQRILWDHGGSIAVASAPGEGTTVCVTLPTSRQRDGARADQA